MCCILFFLIITILFIFAEEKQKPWMLEIGICELLTTYCKGLVPKKSKSDDGAKEDAMPATAKLRYNN